MDGTKTVLIVDDEPDILKMTEFRVKKAGYNTVVAADGHEALRKASSKAPDLILLDYRLPGMDGVEVYKRLQSSGLGDIPVIFLSASKGNEDLLEKMREIGAEHSLIKPYEPQELLGKIRELIG